MALSESVRERKNSEYSASSPLQTCLALSSSQPAKMMQTSSTALQPAGQSPPQRGLGSVLASPSRVSRQRNNIATENVFCDFNFISNINSTDGN